MDMTEYEWGARIERGVIQESNGSQYKVKSLDRDGVITPLMGVLEIHPTITMRVTHDKNETTISETIKAVYEPTQYTLGDKVYFFMFCDGHGAILGKVK